METGIAGLDGHLIERDQVPAARDESSFFRGRALYETILAVRGRLPFANGHFERLRASSKLAGFSELPPNAVLGDRIVAVLQANRLEKGIARVNLRLDADSCLTLARAASDELPRMRREGIDACTVELKRVRPDATHKWVEREQLRAAAVQARASGCQEALLVGPDGQLLEGATSNLFLVLDGQVCTPPTAAGVLPGVTRQLVLETAAQHSIPAIERTCGRDHMDRASELFISSAIRLVISVNAVDGHQVGSGQPGPVSQRLAGTILARAGL